jgi:hypothetical protein
VPKAKGKSKPKAKAKPPTTKEGEMNKSLVILLELEQLANAWKTDLQDPEFAWAEAFVKELAEGLLRVTEEVGPFLDEWKAGPGGGSESQKWGGKN